MSAARPEVVLVDAGGSNLGSVQAALERLGVDAPVVQDWDRIQAATHVILPGVGAAAPAMARLRQFDLIERLRTLQQPVLGVCVGMQVLFEHSDEGPVDGLGLLPGRVVRLPASPQIRIPHMGWNRLQLTRPHPVLAGLDGACAYFVHSYAVAPGACTRAVCMHGQAFTAVAARANVVGAQFHPERSAAAGARLLANFLAWDGRDAVEGSDAC